MTDQPTKRREERAREFARAAEARPRGVLREFWGLITHTKKYWLTPIVVILLLVGMVVMLGGTAIAPFIYTLF